MNGSTGNSTPNSRMNSSAQRNSGTDNSTVVPRSPNVSVASAAQVEQQQSAAEAEHAGDQHRADGELDGGGQRGRHQLSGVAAQLDRPAEVAVQRAAQPDRVLRRAAACRGPSRDAWPRCPRSWRWVASTLPRDRPAAGAARRTAGWRQSAGSVPRSARAAAAGAGSLVTSTAWSAAAPTHWRTSSPPGSSAAPVSARFAAAGSWHRSPSPRGRSPSSRRSACRCRRR